MRTSSTTFDNCPCENGLQRRGPAHSHLDGVSPVYEMPHIPTLPFDHGWLESQSASAGR